MLLLYYINIISYYIISYHITTDPPQTRAPRHAKELAGCLWGL